MKEARKILDNVFGEAISQGVALVDFNATWCAPCRAQDPIVERLSATFEGRATVASVDIDENREMALQLSIHSIPTLILFKDGVETRRFIGLQSEASLSQAIEDILT